MKKFRIIPFLISICLLFSLAAPSAWALDDPKLDSAKAVVLVDLDSGRLLYSLNKDEERSPASLTKVMTLLLAIEARRSSARTRALSSRMSKGLVT